MNFYAEVLGKYLGAARRGQPGTIAKGTAAIRAFAHAHGVRRHRGPRRLGPLLREPRHARPDIVRLLWAADASPWGVDAAQPPGHGRPGHARGPPQRVRVRAKTGTLIGISALSGWVWLDQAGAWAEFSILSRGISKGRSVHIENTIVRR